MDPSAQTTALTGWPAFGGLLVLGLFAVITGQMASLRYRAVIEHLRTHHSERWEAMGAPTWWLSFGTVGELRMRSRFFNSAEDFKDDGLRRLKHAWQRWSSLSALVGLSFGGLFTLWLWVTS